MPAVYAAQAADVLLDAIARSDGTRTSVVDELLATRADRGLLGSFTFDRNGRHDATRGNDPAAPPRRRNRQILSYEGATIDRVVTPPTDLLG